MSNNTRKQGYRTDLYGRDEMIQYFMRDVLVENSTYTARTLLKLKLIEYGILENQCCVCGNSGESANGLFSLEMNHINGRNTDHRLENLEILCLNCHAQTDNYRNRNRAVKAYSCTDSEFAQIYSEETQMSTMAVRIGYKRLSGNVSDMLWRRVDELGLDDGHIQRHPKGAYRTDIWEQLRLGVTKDYSTFRRRLFEENILDYTCDMCGNEGVWLESALALEVHHIDGNRHNQLLENLQVLCPNCHAATDNHGGKSNRI